MRKKKNNKTSKEAFFYLSFLKCINVYFTNLNIKFILNWLVNSNGILDLILFGFGF